MARMGTNSPFSFIFNIDTPDYFANHGNKDSDEPFATISKKSKVSAGGTVFRHSKSKKGHPPIVDRESSHNLIPTSKTFKLSTHSVDNTNKSKGIKVKFSTSVDVETKRKSKHASINEPHGSPDFENVSSTSLKVKMKKVSESTPNTESHLKDDRKQKKSPNKKVMFKPPDELESRPNEVKSTSMKPPNIVSNKSNTSSNSKLSSGKSIISKLFDNFSVSRWRGIPGIPRVPQLMSDIQDEDEEEETFVGKSFDTLNIMPQIVSNIKKLGISTMMPIQQNGLHLVLDGKDVLVKSPTGSGKTLVYLLPIVHALMTLTPKIKRSDGVFALVIVPTRELALQSYQLLEKVCKSCIWVVPGYLIGGERKKAEKCRLRRGLNIVVATPGRILDHLQTTKCLDLSKIKYLAIDEADRMIEMGYEKSVTCIVKSMSKISSTSGNSEVKGNRQTIMLSATLTTAVQKLAGLSLNNPTMVTVGKHVPIDSHHTMPDKLRQYYMVVPTKLRLVTLATFIIQKWRMDGECKILVFVNTQGMVDFHTGLYSEVVANFGQKVKSKTSKQAKQEKEIAKLLPGGGKIHMTEGVYIDKDNDDDEEEEEVDLDLDNENDIHFFKLHGNMTQEERSAVFRTFQKCSAGVLFCTDVASRGLDLPHVHWIIQYNPAYTTSDYVHRVGRTARADCHGSAVVFLDPSELEYVSWAQRNKFKINELKMEDCLSCLTSVSLYDKSISVPRAYEGAAIGLQSKFEQRIDTDHDMKEMAEAAYRSFLRSYAAIPKDARPIFDFKKLHLGHYAKCFGLRDPPNVIGGKRSRSFGNEGPPTKRWTDWTVEDSMHRHNAKEEISKIHSMSEFDAGLDHFEDDEPKPKNMKRKKIGFNVGYKAKRKRQGEP